MKKHYLLASQSPRRKELFSHLGLSFEINVVQIDEHKIVEEIKSSYECRKEESRSFHEKESLGSAVALAVAKKKAEAALELPFSDEVTAIIASDTVVYLDGKILEKPRSAREAVEMLEALAGNVHTVYTAVSVRDLAGKSRSFVSATKVYFYPLDDFMKAFIKRYVESGSPMDKAGAYGIQDAGALMVEKIEGDVDTVIGLPLGRLGRLLYEEF